MSTKYDDLTEPLRDLVARYRAAWDAVDPDEVAAVREQVVALMFEPVATAAARLFKDEGVEIDDVVSTGQEIFFKRLDDYLTGFDLDGPTPFYGYVTAHGGTWFHEVRRLLRQETGAATALSQAEERVVKIFHGARETFRTTHGRYPTKSEVVSLLSTEMLERARGKVIAKSPDLDAEEVERLAARRVSQDGHRAALGRLDELVVAEQAARVVSADAVVGDTGVDGWNRIDAAIPEERDDVDDWVAVATLGMDGRTRRRAVRMLTGAALAEEAVDDAELLRVAHANLANPVAQFVVLAGVEEQFDHEPVSSAKTGGERELLRLAASL